MAIQEFGKRTVEERVFQVVSEIIDLSGSTVGYITGPLIRALHIEAIYWLVTTTGTAAGSIIVGTVADANQFIESTAISKDGAAGDVYRLPLATTDNKLELGEVIEFTPPGTGSAGKGKLIIQIGIPGQGES